MTNDEARKYAPATQRNREPILEVLVNVLPANGTILEVASGTGEHAVFFAPRLKPRKWLPSEPNPQLRASIAAWSANFRCENLYPPIEIDVCAPVWSVEKDASPRWSHFDDLNDTPITSIVNINMVHIAPWSACLGLMAGANRILPPRGILYMYGPFKVDGKHTASSNIAFDESLRAQNSEWGVRDLNDVVDTARTQNLTLVKTYQMPANNLSVIFQRI
ncbi:MULTISPECIES: DUF938 domain-containing protein [Nostocales]|uniref:DUF938 domain-containing protein n=3 Tax=Nostocales TaxID=1161 RepID=A0A0C1R984_9CYAN|nr:DUF938 domain-containing protein [Tolypothrix bouteillei]KAF3890426.1 DUF938 domain-containing protein [Tolypothrix bouteillei VB521301]